MAQLSHDADPLVPGLAGQFLEQAHLLFRLNGEAAAPLPTLQTIVRVAGGSAAGLARCAAWTPVFVSPDADDPARFPWNQDPSLLDRMAQHQGTVRLSSGGMAALAPSLDGPPWLAWLDSSREYDEAEATAFGLLALALGRVASSGRAWAEQATRDVQQQKLEASADLTRRLAHDFGNVLCGILGFTELALGQQMPTGGPLHSYLNEVWRAAQAGAQFTQQLQAFSRRHNSFARPSLLAQALIGLEPRLQAIRDARATVHLDVPVGLPAIALDQDAIHQVLGALIDNAREALAGPGAVSISARVVELDEAACHSLLGAARPGPHVELTVADTGTGLSPEAQQRLFSEPFFSSRPRRKGFGLASAYGILHAHKGGLRLYSGMERGVVVRVVVPVAPTPVPAAVPAVASRPPVSRPRGERLLVVDDEVEVLNYVTTALEQAGYRVQSFVAGRLAMECYHAALASDPFALVLTDVRMPGMDGLELARQIMERDPLARLLFMSGQVSNEFLSHDFVGRSCSLLEKPFRIERLLEAVRAALVREVRRSAVAATLSPAKK